MPVLRQLGLAISIILGSLWLGPSFGYFLQRGYHPRPAPIIGPAEGFLDARRFMNAAAPQLFDDISRLQQHQISRPNIPASASTPAAIRFDKAPRPDRFPCSPPNTLVNRNCYRE